MSNCAGMRASVGVALCVTALLIGACSAKTASSGELSTVTSRSTSPAFAAAPATAQPTAITIEGFKFILADPVPPRAQISVTNKDSVDHTLTADSAGAFNTDVRADSQATFIAPRQPGAYPFHCAYHPSMRGQLVVVQQE